jgi:hypothetical protein
MLHEGKIGVGKISTFFEFKYYCCTFEISTNVTHYEAFLSFLIISCEGPIIPEASSVIGSDHQLVYEHLKYISKHLAIESINSNLQHIVYRYVQKKFDGEFEVLLKDIDDEFDLKKSFSSLKKSPLSTDESKFIYFVGQQNLYAQLYVPNFDSLSELAKEAVLVVPFFEGAVKPFYGYYI